MLRLAGMALTWRQFADENPSAAADLRKQLAEIARAANPRTRARSPALLPMLGSLTGVATMRDHGRSSPSISAYHWLTGKVQFRRQLQPSKSPGSRQQRCLV
jgi:hypothetical protein